MKAPGVKAPGMKAPGMNAAGIFPGAKPGAAKGKPAAGGWKGGGAPRGIACSAAPAAPAQRPSIVCHASCISRSTAIAASSLWHKVIQSRASACRSGA